MKLKYYLRGLGIGIVCTAIIMGIALSGNKKETMTDTEIIERARLLGMVMPEDTDELAGLEEEQESSDNKVSNPEQPEEQKSGNMAGDKNTDGSKTENKADKTNSNEKSDSDKKPGNNKQENNQPDNQLGNAGQTGSAQGIVQIEIKAGEFSDAVSQKLFQAGLVADADAFNKYLTQKGADQTLRVGVYEIPAGATQDEIIEILQKKE